MKLDLKALEALSAVARFGSFGKAANHLHRVQSAISHQIANLEGYLGAELLDRKSYRVKLTAAGEAILAESQQLLSQADHLRAVARQFNEGWEPQLLVVADGILPLGPMLAALKALTDEKVPTRVQISVEFLGGVLARFERDQGQIMLSTEEMMDVTMEQESLPDMDCLLCIGKPHSLARAESVSLAELQKQVELSVQHSHAEQASDRHLFGCERRVYLSSFPDKRQALLMGVGFGWMPFYLIKDSLRTGDIRELPYVGGSRYRVTPRLAYRRGTQHGRAGSRFIELLRAGPWPDMTQSPSRRDPSHKK